MFIIERSLRGALTLFLVFTLVFIATRLSGDPIRFLYPEGISRDAESAMRTYLGLEGTLFEQYSRYFTGFLKGESGVSFYQQRPVSEMLAERLPATVSLASCGFVLAVFLGIPVGVLAALNRGRTLDHLFMSASFVGYSLPNFVLGISLILVFSFHLSWLPSSGMGSWRHYIMPVVSLGLAGAASIARFSRSATLEVLSQDFLRTARAKGVAEYRVVAKHALRNAAIPVVTIIGLQVGTLVAGSVVVETVFAWPGIGSLLVEAALGRDYPVLQYGVIIVALCVITANLLVDLSYGLLDPRIRVGG